MAPIKRERYSEDTSSINEIVQETTDQTPDLTQILARMNALETKNMEMEQKNRELEQKVKEASGDISEQLKKSKREYGKHEDGSTNLDEPRKYKYSVLMDEGKEKVVIARNTIGRPVNYKNTVNGKWVVEHQVKVDFHDGTSKTMDLNEYMELYYSGGKDGDGDFVQYSDINRLPNGEKVYTFKTEKYGIFKINQKFLG